MAWPRASDRETACETRGAAPWRAMRPWPACANAMSGRAAARDRRDEGDDPGGPPVLIRDCGKAACLENVTDEAGPDLEVRPEERHGDPRDRAQWTDRRGRQEGPDLSRQAAPGGPDGSSPRGPGFLETDQPRLDAERVVLELADRLDGHVHRWKSAGKSCSGRRRSRAVEAPVAAALHEGRDGDRSVPIRATASSGVAATRNSRRRPGSAKPSAMTWSTSATRGCQ